MSDSIYGRLVYKSVVLARGEGSVFRRLEALRRLERQPGADLLRRQSDRLAALLSYAQQHCQFYRDRWAATDSIPAHSSRERLATLPLIAKPDVQAHYRAMVAEPRLKRVTRKVTGGSTGQAVTIVKNRSATAAEMAATWMGLGWFGIHVGDRAARFWGTPFSAKRQLRFLAADFAMHRISFSAFAFTDEDLRRYWDRCVAFRPAYLYGYVSMLEAFAAFVRRTGLPGKLLRLKAIVTTSEVLGATQRAAIQAAFGAAVQNEYGCGEFGPIAYECEKGSLHIMSENLVVEVIRSDGSPAAPGEGGELVITDLNNYAMPLVRYRVGDFGVLGDTCGCGRGFPVLSDIWGRSYDFIETPDGKRHHGEYVMYLFEDFRRGDFEIEQFQVTQTSSHDLEAIVTSPKTIPSDRIDRVRTELENRLSGLRVTVRQVPSIARLASGKMHVIRRAVPSTPSDVTHR